MKWTVAALLFIFVAFASVTATSNELCPPTNKNMEWASACFQGAGNARHVKPAYKNKVIVNKAGFATIVIATPRELVAVDRHGAVKVPGIYHTGDFDYLSANQGLGRFEVVTQDIDGARQAKCGYFASRSFKIIIPATYDQCMAFVRGTAAVCRDCTKVCTEPECQDSMLIGGQGFLIDAKNRIVKRFSPPLLEQACNGQQPADMVKVAESTFYLRCPLDTNSPFNKLQ